jgi:NAD(P)-dependent dehydrogenase (short-subunit alcohol dehydrogenase family)
MKSHTLNMAQTVALVTGANRGLGSAFVQALKAAGAKRIYAAARDPDKVATGDRIIPIRLDVTNAIQVADAGIKCTDVTLLINNAAIVHRTSALDPASLVPARSEWETNVIGPLMMAQTFAPVLARNGGGALLNVLTALTWISLPGGPATYSATKAALWSLTNSLRNELQSQGTSVAALHVGFMDTDAAAAYTGQKSKPLDVAQYALRALQEGEIEILADDVSRQLKQGLSAGAYLQPPQQG